MKATSTGKGRFYKLDEIGFVGGQKKRSAKQIKLTTTRTARAIKTLKSPSKPQQHGVVSSRVKKSAKVDA